MPELASRQAEKKLSKLKYVSKKLLPKLEYLKKQIHSKGVVAVLGRYPELLDIYRR